MGEVRAAPLVTPLVAMLAADEAWFDRAKPLLEELLGPVVLESPLFFFNITPYYTATMGPDLQRKFFVFERLADASALAAWKLATNALEGRLREQFHAAAAASQRKVPERPINLDIGYLTAAKLVLASTKDFAHRIYLRDGIFAETTLIFRGEAWTSHQFTFPDYRSGIYDVFLNQARDWHLRKLKESRGPS